MPIQITRPTQKDQEELKRLFECVIADAFAQDGIADREEGIKEEVEKQMAFIQKDFESKGEKVFFLIAKKQGKIIGTIGLSEPSDFMKEHLKDRNLTGVPEITSVYVLPKEQGKGIGALLFSHMLEEIKRRGIQNVCLDGGYKKSQGFWIKKIGEPTLTLKDYWGKELDHMFWFRKVEEL